MKTIIDAEASLQAAAHAVVNEKNFMAKADKIEKLIVSLSTFVQVAGAEIRRLKNIVEGV